MGVRGGKVHRGGRQPLERPKSPIELRLTIERDTHGLLVDRAKGNNRTLVGELRQILSDALKSA